MEKQDPGGRDVKDEQDYISINYDDDLL